MMAVIFVMSLVAIGAGLVGVLLALRVKRKVIQDIQAEHEAWQEAQENARRGWERKQLRRYTELRDQLTITLQEIRVEWEKVQQQSIKQQAALTRQYEKLEQRIRLEQELAVLPHVEDVPLGEDSTALMARSGWHPAKLGGADLRGRDLSHRYLRSAELREARLEDTNLFMADLSGALLQGADLSGADLSGANLCGADLRDANLTGANFQVADLHNANLARANITGALHLTGRQLAAAHLEDLSRVEDDTSLTEPQLPIVRFTRPLDTVPEQPEPVDQIDENSNGHHEITPPVMEQLIPETPLPETMDENAVPDEMEPAITQAEDSEAEVFLSPPPEGATAIDEPLEVARDQAEPASQEEPVSLEASEAAADVPIEAALPESEAISVAPAASVLEEAQADAPSYVMAEEPETDTTASPHLAGEDEAAYDNLLPDLESLLASSADSRFFSPLAPDTSLLDPQVTDSIVEQPEQGQAKAVESDARHNSKHRRGRQARATKR